MELPTLKQALECYIKPKYEVQESKLPYYLSPLDLIFLSMHYSHKGLLFKKPNQETFNTTKLIETLKDSLACTLVHFYPLAGQLETAIDEDQNRLLVFVDCNKGPGVRFVHATLDMTISDIVTPTYVPSVVSSLYDYNSGEINFDGQTKPLLSIQVTELVDGIFIGASMNHAIHDGPSMWHFWHVWGEIHRANGASIDVLHPPYLKRWFPNGYGPKDATFPFTSFDGLIKRYKSSPKLYERIFHFSSNTIANLKAKANEELGNTNIKVSSFQALLALVWRSITRAKRLNPDQLTRCRFTANNRARLNPPMPEEYFGNLLSVLMSTTKASEILEHNLGWTASLLHQSVANHDGNSVQDFAKNWFMSRSIIRFDLIPNELDCVVQVAGSPRLDIYGIEFAGLGKPIAIRCGNANKFDGKVTIYPGNEGTGSVDVEICLTSDFMKALESDEEFMAAIAS